MTRETVVERLKEMIGTVEWCPEGRLAEIDKDLILGLLRGLYQDIKLGVPSDASEPEEYETEYRAEGTGEAEALTDVGAAEEEEEYAAQRNECESNDEPLESDAGDFADTGSGSEVQETNTYRKAILSLYDDEEHVTASSEEKSETELEPIHEERNHNDVVEVAEVTFPLIDTLDPGQRQIIVNELFGGDTQACREAMERLSGFEDLNDALLHIHDHYDWDPGSRGAGLLVDLLVEKLS